MRTTKLLIIALLSTCFSFSAQAQVRLSEEEKETLKVAVKNKLDFFQDQLTLIAARRAGAEPKEQAVKATLALFIGKGEPYTVYENGREVKNTGVKMQTSSVNRSSKRTLLMKSYLRWLKNQTTYSDILIESADAVKIGEIFPERSTGRYYSTATICQHFVGYRDGYRVYEDYTVKTVKIYIEREVVDLPDGELTVWKIQLADITTVDTWR